MKHSYFSFFRKDLGKKRSKLPSFLPLLWNDCVLHQKILRSPSTPSQHFLRLRRKLDKISTKIYLAVEILSQILVEYRVIS